MPATLAGHLGLAGGSLTITLDLGGAPGRANTGDKLHDPGGLSHGRRTTASTKDVLRTGGTACTLSGTVKAPSTLGTFLRSFRWGHAAS